jgi:hypothetical protein
MSWLLLADAPKPPQETGSEMAERRTPIEKLDQGKIFSINSQARKFELVAFDPIATTEFPRGRILARVVEKDGSYGEEVSLDYGEHQGASVVVWNSAESESVTKPYEVFERVRLKGTDLCGCTIELNKSKFPDCDIIVMWEQPLHGDMITEVHGHEIESLGEQLDPQTKFGGGDKSLAEIRQVVMDLRGNHEKKYEDKTKAIVKEQIGQALAARVASIKQFDETTRKQANAFYQAFAQAHAAELRRMADACVLHVTAGDGDYEIERIGTMVTSYADRIWQMASVTTRDPELAGVVAKRAIDTIADVAWRGYFITRFAYIRKEDGEYRVYSEKGKRLGSSPAKSQAVKRLRQIEYWRRHGADIDVEQMDTIEEAR